MSNKQNINKSDIWKILLVFTIGLNLLSYLFKTPILSYIGTSIGLVGIIFPSIGFYFAKAWMKFAEILGRINGTIILSIIFFIFLLPLSLLQKIFSRKDNLQLKAPKESNFININKTYQDKDLEKMW